MHYARPYHQLSAMPHGLPTGLIVTSGFILTLTLFIQQGTAYPSTPSLAIQESQVGQSSKPTDGLSSSARKKDGEAQKKASRRLIRKPQSSLAAAPQPIAPEAPASSSTTQTHPISSTTSSDQIEMAKTGKASATAAGLSVPSSLTSLKPKAATNTATSVASNSVTGGTASVGDGTARLSRQEDRRPRGRAMSRIATEMPRLTQLMAPPSPSSTPTPSSPPPPAATPPPATPPAPVPPAIGASPLSLSFTAMQGGANPATQTLSISNAGGGSLSWSVTDNANWLTASRSGSSVIASVNLAGLSAGSYNGLVTVSASGATNTPQTVPVTLTVTAATPPPPPTPPSSPPSGTFFFDDFERGLHSWDIGACSANGQPPADPMIGCNPSITTQRALAGTHSLWSHHHPTDPEIQTGTYYSRTFPDTDDVWLSVLLRTEGPGGVGPFVPSSIQTKHFIVWAGGPGLGAWVVRQWGERRLRMYIVNHPRLDESITEPATDDLNDYQNYCLEVHFNRGTTGQANGQLELFVDGTRTYHKHGVVFDNTPDVCPTGSTCAGQPIKHHFGNLRVYTQYGKGEVYYDNFAVGPTRIGCAGAPSGPPPPPPPTTGSVTLNWSANTEPDLAGYKVYRATSSGAYGTPIATITGNNPQYMSSGLPVETTYYFVITAFDGAGNESARSAEVSKSIY